jgi:ADP-ribosylglycohydrolase
MTTRRKETLQVPAQARTPKDAGQLACLLGGAIGDALGYRVEFDRWPEIERKCGPAGIQLASARGPLVASDDTQMTLFTLEGMTRATSTDGIVGEIREARRPSDDQSVKESQT